MTGRVLLHACCAPCLTVTGPFLRDEGMEPTALYYNPNIHPWREWKLRMDTLKSWTGAEGIPLVTVESYPLEENVRMLLSSTPRCRACLADRLGATARAALAEGYKAFSTTLMLSPYTDHALLRDTGRAASSETGVEFVYSDLRALYPRSVELSRQAGLYRQPYCGCIFSERDRFSGRG